MDGLILGPALFKEISVTFTNACAENWRRVVKKNIFKDETKLRPAAVFTKNLRSILVLKF